MTIRAIPAQDNATNAPTDTPRRAAISPSLDSTGWPSSPSAAVSGKGSVPNITNSASRRPHNGPSISSSAQDASQAPTHAEGLLSLMADFNARGGAQTAATRRLVDGASISKGQLAAVAARAKPSADARAFDGELAHKDRLAAARAKLAAKLAAEGRVVATVSQQVSSSGSHVVNGAPPRSVRPGPAQPCITVGPDRLLTRKLERCVPAGTVQSGVNTAIRVKQPVHNNAVIDLSPVGGLKPEIEADRRSTGHSVSRALPIYALERTPKSSSTKPATAAASTTTTTSPSQSVSEKAQAIAHRYASAAKSSSKLVQNAAAEKLAQGANRIDFDAGQRPSTKLTAANKMTGTTPSQSVDVKVQAILHRYGKAMNALDDTSAAAFIAHKLEQDTRHSGFNAAKETSTSVQLKTPATPNAQSPKGLGVKHEVAKTVDVDDGFDVVNSKGPSAANGSPLPDPDLFTDQLEEKFSPTLKSFQGWEDDYDSDDSEEWDLGGLAEWKWVGEKSAKESSAAKRQA